MSSLTEGDYEVASWPYPSENIYLAEGYSRENIGFHYGKAGWPDFRAHKWRKIITPKKIGIF